MDQTNPRASMDRTLEQFDSKFRFVLLAAQRAEQLIRGARPKVELPLEKPTRLAMEELQRNLVEWDYGPRPGEAPEEGVELEEGGEAYEASAAPEASAAAGAEDAGDEPAEGEPEEAAEDSETH